MNALGDYWPDFPNFATRMSYRARGHPGQGTLPF